MFEQFTDRARKVMALANQEAQRFNHEYIGTEHILLGLVKEGSGVGANVLKNSDETSTAASPRPPGPEADLEQVMTAWPKLPLLLRQAILAIIHNWLARGEESDSR